MEAPGAADYSEMADAGKGQCEDRTVSGCPSQSWQRPIQLVQLAHLSQVDCQFGIRHKALQNNNLQFYSCLFGSTWLTLRTATGPVCRTCAKLKWGHPAGWPCSFSRPRHDGPTRIGKSELAWSMTLSSSNEPVLPTTWIKVLNSI